MPGEPYQSLLEKAQWSHENQRSVFHLDADDVALARLYCYGYRSQTIGTFHATRLALLEAESSDREHLLRAIGLLQQLAAQALLPVPTDCRAVISTLFYYDRWTRQTVECLEMNCAAYRSSQIQRARDLFVARIDRVRDGGGIYLADDVTVPEQASFIVPNLQITIVPVIYGDHHSWNIAFLTADSAGVTAHRHHEGVEIHLGFSPIEGRTILGEHGSMLTEGYAMPIPAMTDHGFDNLSGHEHIVPFIFGSSSLSGWGIFFDVQACPIDSTELAEVPLDGPQMNGSVFLEREIDCEALRPDTGRRVLIPADATRSSADCGSLELGIARVGRKGLDLRDDTYRIISIRRGAARLRIGPATADLNEHDHAGIPAGLDARIDPRGNEPLVFLDATLTV